MSQQFRKGDRISIEGIVKYDGHGDDEICVEIEGVWGSGSNYYVKTPAMKMVKADIRVGDTVEWIVSGCTFFGEVLAIKDDHAWVNIANGGEYATVWLESATPVDPEPVKAEEAA